MGGSTCLNLYSFLGSSPEALSVNNWNPQATFLLEGTVTSMDGVQQKLRSSSAIHCKQWPGLPGVSKAAPRFSASLSESMDKLRWIFLEAADLQFRGAAEQVLTMTSVEPKPDPPVLCEGEKG